MAKASEAPRREASPRSNTKPKQESVPYSKPMKPGYLHMPVSKLQKQMNAAAGPKNLGTPIKIVTK